MAENQIRISNQRNGRLERRQRTETVNFYLTSHFLNTKRMYILLASSANYIDRYVYLK